MIIIVINGNTGLIPVYKINNINKINNNSLL